MKSVRVCVRDSAIDRNDVAGGKGGEYGNVEGHVAKPRIF